MPAIIDINVVFPAPLGPRMTKISPLLISKETFFRASKLLYIFYLMNLFVNFGCISNPNFLLR